MPVAGLAIGPIVMRPHSTTRVIQGTTSTAGRVIGIDPSTDVALVQTATPLTGYQFHFGDAPKVGDAVAAIGFPEGDPLSYNTGTITGSTVKRYRQELDRRGA